MSAGVLDRIKAKVQVTDAGCWEFTGHRMPGSGYGRVGWDGRLWLTHRVTYTLLVGPIADRMEIDHLCKNKPCCNPAHLEAVTHSENIRRGTQCAQPLSWPRRTALPSIPMTPLTPTSRRAGTVSAASASEKPKPVTTQPTARSAGPTPVLTAHERPQHD